MLFNSAEFIFVFLPIVLVGFAILGRFGRVPAISWLGLASIVFYARWSFAYVFLLLASILVNFTLSRLIASTKDKPRWQNFWLALGIVVNLGALVYFKYLFPLLRVITHWGNGHHHWSDVVLPLGISFFTFTQIGYLIDLKAGEAEPQSLVSYILFVTFFPHLIAGPILHHKEIMPQFAEERRYGLNRADFSVGLTWFVMGLFKKVMVADNLVQFVKPVFDDPTHQSAAAAWMGALCYMLELYFDFSGYSDMAIGLARMFSIRFPFNFNSPYKAKSIIEFWSRWHMTLTNYITLYLYSPLSLKVNRARLDAGKKVSRKASKTLEGFLQMVAYPTILTMGIAGIWHGAGLNYIIFGLIFGICITLEHAWNLLRTKSTGPHPVLGVLSVLRVNLIVLVALVFFRASSTRAALALLSAMAGVKHAGANGIPPFALVAIALFPVVWFMPNTQQILGQTEMGEDPAASERTILWKPTLTWGVVTAVTFFLSLINMSSTSTFLYFQF